MTTIMEALDEHNSNIEIVSLLLDIIDDAVELPECLTALIYLDKGPLKRQRGGDYSFIIIYDVLIL
jgi:hypothetical protein